MIKRALVSVTDKTGVVEFCTELNKLGYEVISTGNTFKMLKEQGVKAIQIDEKYAELMKDKAYIIGEVVDDHEGVELW